MKTIEGNLDNAHGHYALVAARFNERVVEGLIAGAADTLRRHGVADADLSLIRVPGAFELPVVARRAATSGQFDAVIALGAVIRGETAHFEHIATQCAAGLSRVALETDCPVAFGVLTAETAEQALARAGNDTGNKGAEAAAAALETVDVLRQLARPAR